MLFYSMTIQNVQSIVIDRDDDFSAPDYAIQMVEVVENLIVKVEKILPPERKIPIDAIKEWKEYSRNFFNSSPNVFLSESQFYN